MSDAVPLLPNDITDDESELSPDSPQPSKLFKNYRFRNLLAFNLSGFFAISFVIFLTSSQPFFISQILRIDNNRIGKIIGLLGVVDELTSILTSPLIGSLNDKINNSNLLLNGSKLIVFGSFLLITISFLIYGLWDFHSWYQLIVPRIIFAVGITSGMSMIPVLLHQLIYSDFKFSKIFYWKRNTDTPNSNLNKNGKYSAMIGIATGLGAIFSVSCFLSLPVKLSIDFDLTAKEGLKLSFVIIGSISILVGLFMLTFLYSFPTKNSSVSYFQLLATGWSKFLSSSSVKIACIGGFIARSTSVLIAVFIPLYVYKFYYQNGLCDADGLPSKTNCYDGYVFAAIMSGVVQTIGLISSPFWGYAIDKFGKVPCLVTSSLFGIVGNLLMVLFNLDDPRSALVFFLVSLVGISQIGTVITSMSLISVENDIVGSISGIYNLFGGLGILLLNQFGGFTIDYWSLSPFFIMGLFNAILIVSCFFSTRT
ncbi:hypothetical protein CLIB1444_01S09362 [[Candida] jaroonii]|uniref:Uncharacterized protein n=1 Tax=[Candida] jaroonii TaxID=467808 RepID=A0ACA9Y2I6_9ASCO|nr:hypothetical protein CLIB1444_01S09362 [[Candida] jaroonii]